MQKKETGIRKVLKLISRYLDSPESVITDIRQVDYFNDYPFFYHFVTEYMPRRGWVAEDLLANGISLNKEEAVVKAVMETVERWYLSNYKEEDLVFDSFSNLLKKNRAINPEDFLLISENQKQERRYSEFDFDGKERFYWVLASSIRGEEAYIPAQLIYFMHNKKKSEPMIRLADSTGAAAGTSIPQALYNSICELIERDAYAITYYNKLPGRRIDLKSLSKETKELIRYVTGHYFEIVILDITLDVEVPVVVCLLIDRTGVGPEVSVGVKCSLFFEEAIYGSIFEALQNINATRDMVAVRGVLKKREFEAISDSIRPILDRVMFWAEAGSLEKIRFLIDLQDSKKTNKSDIAERDFEKLLSKVVEKLENVGIKDIYWKQVTPESLDKFGLYSVKTVIPELQSIPLDGRYCYFGGDRLYTVPVRLGFRDKSIKEGELNRIPHPLP